MAMVIRLFMEGEIIDGDGGGGKRRARPWCHSHTSFGKNLLFEWCIWRKMNGVDELGGDPSN